MIHIILCLLLLMGFIMGILGSGNLTEGKPFFHPDGFAAKTCKCERSCE